ncbi:ABC transporter ATP-binding protein [Mesorhizobium amorphae]|uniref:ABC transporter ATP-binding protein n=1 Tax=Mesorhizobium amorphae TaxID=71433 RepID=UPI001183745D|nr:ABC transporter ATP-binding protein [Mesorhizobium amorphae]
MARVELKNVSKRFGTTRVLEDVNLTIEDGEFVVFVGPSGCGKSTLLRLIAGLDDISDGQILIDGTLSNRLTPRQRNVAMVFQSYALYPHMTAAQNIAFGLTLERKPRAEIERRVEMVANTLGLAQLLARRPGQLSGGQRQRVAIGRALVREPRVFLMDEPLSNLDAGLRTEMRVELSELHRRVGTTTVYVTHDQVEAMTLADRVVVMNAGRVEQIGTPMEIYNRPVSKFVAGFMGSPKMNFIETAPDQGASRVLGIRPEHIQISKAKGAWSGSISLVERLGSDTVIYVKTEDGRTLSVRETGQHDYALGASVALVPQEEHLHRFDHDGQRLS